MTIPHRARMAVVTALAAVFLTGCATVVPPPDDRGPREPFREAGAVTEAPIPHARFVTTNYFTNRLRDLVDPIGLRLGWQRGAQLHVQGTRLFAFGLESYDGIRTGFQGRYHGTWNESLESGSSLFFLTMNEGFRREALAGNPPPVLYRNFRDKRGGMNSHRWSDVGGSLGWFFVIEGEVNLMEIADLVAGLFFVDLVGDDGPAPVIPEAEDDPGDGE